LAQSKASETAFRACSSQLPEGICFNFAMRRTSRRWVAAMTLLGMFGMQWALAAHACALTLDPTGRRAPDAASEPVSSHCATMAGKVSPQDPGLCLEHCTKGKEATGSVATTDAPAPMSVAALAVETAAFAQIANSWSPPQLQNRNNSPPPLLLSSRLRI
jgi:hypothetical protein